MVAKPRTKKGRTAEPRPDELTAEQECALQEHEAQKYLGISADEFVRRWHAGEYDGVDNSNVIRVAMLFPFGR
jgi:hypothetical protein